MIHLREYIRMSLDEKLRRGHKAKRVLYHINRHRPARPQPKMTYWQDWDPEAIDREGDKGDYINIPGTDNWQRHWLDSPVKSGVFLTPNPLDIAMKHGRSGHVYAYKVPEWVIAKSGGLHRYDTGSEVLIPEDVWNEAGKEIEFLGKSMSKEELWKKMDGPMYGPGHHRKASKPSWLTDEEMEQWESDKNKFNLAGLRNTKHPEDVIKLLKPKERRKAIEALKAKKKFEVPRQIEKGPRDKKGIVVPSFGWGLDKKDEELLALLQKHMIESIVQDLLIKSDLRKYVKMLLAETRIRQPGDLSQEELLALIEYMLTGNGVYDFTEKLAGSHAEITQSPDTGEFTSRSKQARSHGRPGQEPRGVAKKIADQMTSLPTPERSRRLTFELIDVVNRPDYINYLIGDKPVAVEYSGMLSKEEAESLNSAQENITFITREDIGHAGFNISETDMLVIENLREKLNAGRVSRAELRHAGLKLSDVLSRSVPASVLGGPIEGFMVQAGSSSYKVVNPEYAHVQRLQAPLYAAFSGRARMSKRDIRSRLMNPTAGDRMIQDIKRYLESVSEMPEGFRSFFSPEEAEEILAALDNAISGDADAGDRVYRRVNHRVNDRDSWVNT